MKLGLAKQIALGLAHQQPSQIADLLIDRDADLGLEQFRFTFLFRTEMVHEQGDSFRVNFSKSAKNAATVQTFCQLSSCSHSTSPPKESWRSRRFRRYTEGRRIGVLNRRSHIIAIDCLYPLAFDSSNSAPQSPEYFEDPAFRTLADFFLNKGLESLKGEDRAETWHQDWIDYQAKHGLYASLLSPKDFSKRGHHLSLQRLTRFLEVFAWFSPAHAYSAHVSFLGLFPILMSSNEVLKKEAIARLEGGGLFAFAVSEKEHGADLFANEFTLAAGDDGGQVARGRKYYIGNANAASMMSILARKVDRGATAPSKRSPFVFFALRPQEAPAYRSVRKIHTLGIRAAFVGEFEVDGHHVSDGDVIAEGREAWDAVFGAVTFGKYFLGFGSIGICERSFAESLRHLRRRILYGKPVTAMPHIRGTLAQAFGRVLAMKFYAFRALDYLQAANTDERRYLLYNAVQKATVSTEGVKVMQILSECIGARGFESETYFESALRDVVLIPSLEGSTHINFGLTAQFLDSYFAENCSGKSAPDSPRSLAGGAALPDENPYWFNARDRNAKTVRFAHFLAAYEPLSSCTNVRQFVKQARAFREVAERGVGDLHPSLDAGVIVAMGKCFSTICFAQLVAENCLVAEVPLEAVSVIFHCLIEDLAAAALKLAAMFPPESAKRILLQEIARVPETTDVELNAVWAMIEARYALAK